MKKTNLVERLLSNVRITRKNVLKKQYLGTFLTNFSYLIPFFLPRTISVILFKFPLISDCESNLRNNKIVQANSFKYLAEGVMTCKQGKKLFYSNGTFAELRKTKCEFNAKWDLEANYNLECWGGKFGF